jgi:hypothetical protein
VTVKITLNPRLRLCFIKIRRTTMSLYRIVTFTFFLIFRITPWPFLSYLKSNSQSFLPLSLSSYLKLFWDSTTIHPNRKKKGQEKPGDKTNLVILFLFLFVFAELLFVDCGSFICLSLGGVCTKISFGLFLPLFLRRGKSQVIN